MSGMTVSSVQLKIARLDGPAGSFVFNKEIREPSGWLFGIFPSHPFSEAIQSAIGLILNTLEETAENPEVRESQHLFECLLQRLNETVAEASLSFPVSASPSDFRIVVGLATENKLFLSGTGETSTLFLHRLPDERFQVFNLSRGLQTESGLPSWEKIFAVALEGDLSPGDVFCASNLQLQQEIPADELHAALTTLPPQGASAQIRQFFPAETDCALFILKVQALGDEHFLPFESEADESAAASLSRLQEERKQTARVLADQRPTIPASFFRLVATYGERLKRTSRGLWRGPIRRAASFGLLATLRGLSSVIRVFQRTFSANRSFQRKTAPAPAHPDRLRRGLRMRFSLIANHFKHLPRATQWTFVGAVFLCLILIFSVRAAARSQAHKAAEQAFLQAVSAVEGKRDEAAAAFIYKDLQKAASSLSEAFALLPSIPIKIEGEKERVDTLQKELEGMQKRAQKITSLSNPALLADLSSLSPDLSATSLAWDGKTLIAAGNDRRWYVLKDRKQWERMEMPEPLPLSERLSSDDGTVYALHTPGSVSLWQASSKIGNASIISAAEGHTWKNVFAYADRLYLLDQQTGGNAPKISILRSNRSGSSLSQPAPWLKTNTTDLSDAVALAVDGTVLVLKKDGKIVRFVSGSEVSWPQKSVEPAIANAVAIQTSAADDFISLLDSESGRLVVFHKETGALEIQYQSEVFKGASDFIVDLERKELLVLNGSKIYSIAASYLK